MTPLSEALLASQRQAIGALSKAFLAGRIDAEHLLEELDAIGCRDVVEQGTLLASLTVMARFGTATPTQTAAPETKPAAIADDKWLVGKHKDTPLSETPEDYLRWYAEKGPDPLARERVKAELSRRDDIPF